MSWITGFLQWLGGLFVGSGNSPPTTKVAQIQAAAVKVCSFLPTADTVINILAQGNPVVMTVDFVAKEICQIVHTHDPIPTMQVQSLVGEPTPPKLQTWKANGITVQGAFIK